MSGWTNRRTVLVVIAFCLFWIVPERVPLFAQQSFELPSYPSRRRFETDSYRKIVEHLKAGRTQQLLDLINVDPLISRAALVMLLREPALDRLSGSFARLFPSASHSPIEPSLQQFVQSANPEVRQRVLDAFQRMNELEIGLRRAGFNDDRGREISAAAESMIDGVIGELEAAGFEEGKAEALFMKGKRVFDFKETERLPIVLEEAAEIFRRHGNLRGEFNCLARLADFNWMRGHGRNEEDRKRKADELIDQYSRLVEQSDDSVLRFFLQLRLPDDRSRILEHWKALKEVPGLPQLKFDYLSSLADSDSSYRDEIDLLISGQDDPVIIARMNYQLFWHYFRREDSRSFEPARRAAAIAESLGYDISAFDSQYGWSPPVPGAAAIRMELAGALNEALEYESAREENSRIVHYLDESRETWTADQLNCFEPVLLKSRGENARRIGDFDGVVELFQRSGQILEEIGESHLSRLVYRSLAELHTQLGDFHSAEEVLNVARGIPTEHFDFTSILLADLNLNFGRYDEALRWIDIAEEESNTFGRFSWWGTARLIALAKIWLQLGDFDQALEYAIAVEDRPPSHWISQGIVGEVLIARGDYTQAETYFRKRLEDSRDRNRKPLTADALKNLGRIQRELGRFDDAIHYLEQSLDLVRTIGDSKAEQEVLQELGLAHLGRQENGEAGRRFEESLRIASAMNETRGMWTCHFNLGKIAEAEGNRPGAIDRYRAAIRAVESVSEHFAVELHKASFLKDKTVIYDQLIRLLGPTEPKEAFLFAEKRRAQAYLTSVRKRGLPPGDVSTGLVKRKQLIERQLIGKQSAIRDEMMKPLGQRNESLILGLDQELLRIRREHSDLLESIDLQRGVNAFREGFISPLRVEAIQSRVLGPRQVIVQFVVTDDAIYGFVVDQRNCRFYQLFGNRSELNADVTSLLKPFHALKEGQTDLLHLDYDVSLSHRLFQRLIEPIEPAFGEAGELIIIPDDVLHYLPFEALARDPKQGPIDRTVRYGEYAAVDWLIRHYTVIYAISATSLDPRLQAEHEVPKRLIAFAEPLVRDSEVPERQTALRGSSLNLALHTAMAPLPKAVDEIRAIAEQMEGSLEVVTLTGEAATESNFFESAPQGGYLHFAVHSIVDDQAPDYSSLVLAADSGNDGFLQAFEVLRTSLSADLVVLSGCETGLGRFYRGEGLLGLQRSFLIAGARSIVVSLWSIEDSTAGFMEEFYRLLSEGMTSDWALRNAKLTYLQTRQPLNSRLSLSLSHPFFWAPMTLTSRALEKGNHRPDAVVARR